MTAEDTAKAAIVLLERVDLKGSEVSAFLEVNTMLKEIATGGVELVPVNVELSAVEGGKDS